MRRLRLILLLLLLPAARFALADAAPVTQWRSGFIELHGGWHEYDGDDMGWARPGFDDSAWQEVDIEDMGAAKAGWRWFRLHVNVGPDHANSRLLVDGGESTYELYVNGARVQGTEILSPFAIGRPTERVFKLGNSQDDNDRGDFEIALRTFTTPSYAVYELPLFLDVTIGNATAIEYERRALESDRLYAVAPSVAIDLLLTLGGLGALALFASQRAQREYLFLGFFFFLTGVSAGLWHLQQAGILPLSLNFLFADPLLYPISIAQIEFTLSFARQRAGRGWRIYEGIILLPILAVGPMWLGHFPSNIYNLLQVMVTAPLAFLLPALLVSWYRRGNREAGWLVVPILLPTVAAVLYDLGVLSFILGWNRFDFFIDSFMIGPVAVQPYDVANLLFLFAIGVVMFLRFTRVSRDQARQAAELGAAREIQRQLVPETLPAMDGFRIETAYFPAQEVGGDFYQVLEQADGSALVVVGDVSGKGLKAAMTGALAIGALRTLSSEGLSPAELLARLNREILRTEDGGFITCLCARVWRDGRAAVANAGHLAPYCGGEEIALNSGLPLGITREAEYEELAIRLAAGDTLTLLSDGVVEARNATGELFGFERTRAISGQPAEKIAEAAQGFGQDDDITVLKLTLAPATVTR